jgi:HEAT repeat protein
LPHSRLVIGFLLLIVLARINGSGLPLVCTNQNGQQQTLQIEAEVARWAAQLKSGNAEERRDAVIMLSQFDGDSATSALVSALTDSLPEVRALALGGLGARPEQGLLPPVVARLTSDKNPFVRKAAAYALAGFSGPERTAALIGALRDKDQEVRGASAVALGEHADSTAVAPLAVALSDKSAFVRAQAARALGVNGRAAASAVHELVRRLATESDPEVKRHAATALGTIGDRSALPALERASRDSDFYLAEAARHSIRMIQEMK